MIIYAANMVYVYVELYRIYTDLNFGVISIGTLRMSPITFKIYLTLPLATVYRFFQMSRLFAHVLSCPVDKQTDRQKRQ